MMICILYVIIVIIPVTFSLSICCCMSKCVPAASATRTYSERTE